MKNEFLDHCWVCSARFVTANPPGEANEERHHIVPRAYGGVDGPQVSLCDSCHSKVHKLAVMLERNSVDYALFNNMQKDAVTRLTYLSKVIYNAKCAVMRDPNKLLPVMFKVSKEEALKVDKLKNALGMKSRKDVYQYAVNKLYTSHFAK